MDPQRKGRAKGGIRPSGVLFGGSAPIHPAPPGVAQRRGLGQDYVVHERGQASLSLYTLLHKGYYSPLNRAQLDSILELNVMPKKGGPSKADRAREDAPAFVKARRQHPAIESAINNLNQRGLDRIRTHGLDGFVRTVALGVVAANVHRLGQMVKQQLKASQKWPNARRKAA